MTTEHDDDPFDLTFLKLLVSAAFLGAFALLPALVMTWLLRLVLSIETGTALVCSLLAMLIGTVTMNSIASSGITELMLQRMFGRGMVRDEDMPIRVDDEDHRHID